MHKSARYHALHGFDSFEAAGLVSLSVSRRTRTLVGIYHAEEAGIAEDGYITKCEDHGTIAEHGTLADARYFAPDPSIWCGECQHRIGVPVTPHRHTQTITASPDKENQQ